MQPAADSALAAEVRTTAGCDATKLSKLSGKTRCNTPLPAKSSKHIKRKIRNDTCCSMSHACTAWLRSAVLIMSKI